MTRINIALKNFFTTAAAFLLIAVGPINECLANEVNIKQRASNTDQIQLEWPSQVEALLAAQSASSDAASVLFSGQQ